MDGLNVDYAYDTEENGGVEEDDEVIVEPEADKIEEVAVIDDRELVVGDDANFELNANETVKKEETDLIVIEISVIIIIIMICGLLYAGWRFLIDRRQKERELGYYNVNLSNELLIKSP